VIFGLGKEQTGGVGWDQGGIIGYNLSFLTHGHDPFFI